MSIKKTVTVNSLAGKTFAGMNEKMMLQWVSNWFYNNALQLDNRYNTNYQPQRTNRRASKPKPKNRQPVEVVNSRKGLETKKRKALEAANLKKGLETKITEEGNKGFDLMKKMGYQEGQGLGKDNSGILQPLPLAVKTDRKGLGAKKTTPMEVQVNTKAVPQTGNQRKDLPQPNKKHEKAAIPMQVDKKAQTTTALKIPVVSKQIKTAPPTVSKAIPMQVDQTIVKVEVVPKQINGKATSALNINRRKHSPIRAPEPSPPSLPAAPAKIKGQLQTPIIVKEEPNFTAFKTLSSILIDSDSSGDTKFLQSVLDRYYSKIELMQLRLEAEASSNPLQGENDLIVAKIRIGQNEPIANHAFEFIRTELVGWIGVYQEQVMETPIFHSMTCHQRHISVVCDNAFAYKCLNQCIDDIAQMKTMGGSIKLTRLPHITSLIYCFDALYEGVVRDPELFLNQIQKHKPKLNAENWMIASHEVFMQDRKTYFMFLVDERSALALNFQYSSSFCICMQKLVFRNRGIVADEYLN